MTKEVKIQGRIIRMPEHEYAPVTYVPNHADGNPNHKDAEHGVIIRTNTAFIFVLYCSTRTIQATNPRDLVWG